MFINVVRPENWEELNDEVKSSLNLPPKVRARVYQGLAQAVFEISQGTAQFMSHKKSVAFVAGQNPLMDALLPYYYKETYEVQKISHRDLQTPQQWVESLKKDTNFVLFSEDHPVTGELYPFVEELDRLLNEKRIFSFRISHARHFFDKAELRPYTVRFCSYDPHLSVAHCGERFRTPSLMAHTMEWDKKNMLATLEESLQNRQTEQKLVEDFEKDISSIGRAFLSAGASRLWDRAVCVFPDVSADALAQVLFKKLKISDEQGWRHMATTNMCAWSVVKMFHHWWEPSPSKEDLRGLLIVGTPMLQTKDFAKLLISSYEDIKAEQSWSV